ncbi:hypothetical protein Rsub_12426 [Raphidocelis subcapitata]|uniref:F-box domain-containing protein n=1 Tax=Raphidocelis subcapitata TaxID=307507 RepID=A0A2V0PIT0_9CHLO|nr:hypothetical protein Rsub_12426 [Raphidocelis subcapitata]|eukprot:GBF99714.1 hypothetical protein Rsub_12426 [Raphidocelis subcapitata]
MAGGFGLAEDGGSPRTGGGATAAAAPGASLLLRLPPKLIAQHVLRGRLLPWELSQVALTCRQARVIACASIPALVLRDARFAGGGSGSFSGSGASSAASSCGGAPPQQPGSPANLAAAAAAASAAASAPAPPLFSACTAVVLRPRTMAALSKMVSGLLLPGHLISRLPALEELAVEIHDVLVAQCDLSLHVTSVSLHAKRVRRLRIDQPGVFTVREAAAVARMPALESLAIVVTQGLEPGALATLATGGPPSGNGGSSGGAPPTQAGLRGRLRSLHIEIVTDDAPPLASGLCAAGAAASPHAGAAPAAGSWVGAPLSPATLSGRQAPGPPPKMSAADEMALQGFAWSLESLALIGLEPQLRGAITRPWEPLLSEAAEAGPGPAGAPLQRLALRCCGAVGSPALAAAADVANLAQVDLSASAVAASDVERLARLPSLAGLGISPLPIGPSLIAALAAGCPALTRVSAGGLALPTPPPPASQRPASPGNGGANALPAPPPASPKAAPVAALPLVRELQLLGCGAGAVPSLSRGGGLCHAGALAAAFPGLTAVEIGGVWDVDAAAIAALCELLSCRAPRLARLALHGSAARPLHAPLLTPLVSAPAAPGGRGALVALELLAVEGLDDEWMADAAARAAKSGRCAMREVRELALGGVPPPPSCPIGVPPPPPVLAAPPQAKPAASGGPAAAKPAAPIAPPALPPPSPRAAAPPGALSDKGLVRLFGCTRLRAIALHHLPGVTLAGVKALTRGVPAIERVTCVACPQMSAAPREAVARAGVLGGTRVVSIVVCDQ